MNRNTSTNRPAKKIRLAGLTLLLLVGFFLPRSSWAVCNISLSSRPFCNACSPGETCMVEGDNFGTCITVTETFELAPGLTANAGDKICGGTPTISEATADDVVEVLRSADTNAAPASDGGDGTPIEPRFSVNIPTVQFSDVEVSDGYVSIPWIADYIAGVYRYAVFAASVLAAVMMMIGGIQWLTSAGDAGRVSAAKSKITNSVVALALVIGSYLILNAINPNLTALQPLRVKVIDKELLGFGEPDLSPDDGGANWSNSASSGPMSTNSDITTSNEDCQRVAQLVQSGEIRVANPSDRAGLINGGVIERSSCKWCYSDQNISPNSTASVNRGDEQRTEQSACYGEGTSVPINPKICTTLLQIHEAEERGDFNGPWVVTCIICGHSRCAKRTEDVARCTRCIDSAEPNQVAWGQSNHWRGSGMDLNMNEDLQQWIFENLQSLGIVQLYGSAGWADYGAINCPTRYTSEGNYRGNPHRKNVSDGGSSRSGSTLCAYCCTNGRCPTTVTAATMCGHLNHIHLGFGQ